MLCETFLSNTNSKPSMVQEHCHNQYGGADFADHDEKSLRAKRAHYDSQTTLPKLGYVSVNKPLPMASYQVAFKVAKSKKCHSIAEELIKNHVH